MIVDSSGYGMLTVWLLLQWEQWPFQATKIFSGPVNAIFASRRISAIGVPSSGDGLEVLIL
jgi:hypothetical protein